MPNPDGSEPIADDEILYRRIPESTGWYQPKLDKPVARHAFRPNKSDVDGISLWRATYVSIEQAAQGKPGKRYYVALLEAGELRKYGIDVVPDVEGSLPGHAVIPKLHHEDQKSDAVLEATELLANRLCLGVKGPFETSKAVE